MSEFGLKRALAIIYTVVLSTPASDLRKVLLASGGQGNTKRPFLDLINACWVPPDENPARKTVMTRNSHYGRALVAAREQKLSPQEILTRLKGKGGVEGLAASVRRPLSVSKVAVPVRQGRAAVDKIQPPDRNHKTLDGGQRKVERRKIQVPELKRLRKWKVFVSGEDLGAIIESKKRLLILKVEHTDIGYLIRLK